MPKITIPQITPQFINITGKRLEIPYAIISEYKNVLQEASRALKISLFIIIDRIEKDRILIMASFFLFNLRYFNVIKTINIPIKFKELADKTSSKNEHSKQ